jgi:predicted alpha/beta-fold hydrolase
MARSLDDWLPGAHLQTIVPALFSQKPDVAYRRERWDTPDGDFIDLDWLADGSTPVSAVGTVRGDGGFSSTADTTENDAGSHNVAGTPLLVLFHGLEGNSDSHYARAAMHAALQRGWRAVIPHFRSCSGEINRAPRFYHSGDSAEIDWILRRLAIATGGNEKGPLFVIGISLGGNALLRWLGENPDEAARLVSAAAAVSAPVDLHAGGRALGKGFNRVYTRHFLQTLKVKSAQKLQQYPRLFDHDAMLAARDLHAFDDIVTAPLHGFRDADDYWRRASSKPLLPEITVPTLLLNARNDPFLPAAALPSAHQVSSAVTIEQPETGGHVGFMSASARWRFGRGPEDTAESIASNDDWLAQRLLTFLSSHRSR